MAYENLLVDVRDGVGFVTVDREAKHNALDDGTIEDLDRAFAAIGSDASVRAVVLTGAGEKAFVATLEAVNGGLDRPLAEALEGEAALFGEVAATEDAREGTRAFLEKRPARFAGR